MKPTDDIQKYIEQSAVQTNQDKDDKVLSQMMTAFNQNQSQTADTQPSVWRIFMKSRITKLAAAAAIIIVLGLVAYQYNIPIMTSEAYAVEQTLNANRSIRSIHIKVEKGTGQMKEAWAQFDEDGKCIQLRFDMPETEDGHKIVYWKPGEAKVKFIDKKSVLTVTRKEMIERFPKNFFDPIMIVEDLYEREMAGGISIDIDYPENNDGLIVMDVTDHDRPSEFKSYYIDPDTRLLLRLETYKDNGETLTEQIDYLEYNQPIDPDVFVVDAPDDYTKVDWVRNEIGLERGDLTEEEICVKVVREFFQALIDKDYAKAGRLFSGIPADKAEEMLSKVNVVRIIEIGKPYPNPRKNQRGYRVPCEFEIEGNGRTQIMKRPGIGVREATDERQPDQWYIFGGF